METTDDNPDRFSQIEDLINRRFDSLQETNDRINDRFLTSSATVRNLERENRDLHKKVLTMEDRLLKLEQQVNNTEQNNRKNNFEVEGIPSSVTDQQLRFVVATPGSRMRLYVSNVHQPPRS